MSTTNFAALLNNRPDEAKPPQPLPAGSYLLVITKWEPGESSQKKTPYVRFHYSIQQPMADVDPSQLAGIDLTKKSLRDDFYLTPDAEYRLAEFLRKLGIATEGRTYAQILAEVMGRTVIGTVTQRPVQRQGSTETIIVNDIADYAPAV